MRLREAQRAGGRILVDDVEWLVYELPPMVFDRRNRSSLVFESDTTVRRIRHFPTDWRELGADDLFALSWST